MSPRRIVPLAIGTQALLIVVAWGLATLLDLPPRWGDPYRDTIIGLAAAAGLAAVNYLVLVKAPATWVVDGVRAVYREILVPLFGRLDTPSLIAIGAAAGVGEEWLFRGILQPAVGLLAASVAFGLAHVGGLSMLAFGVWAMGMGVAMGSLALATGGLIAPMVAHGVYDMLALHYIRRQAERA